jgi:hypothetical protein
MYALQRSSGRHLIKLPPSDLTFWAVLCLNCGSAIRLDAGASRSPCLREQSPKPHFSRVQVSKVSLYLYLVVIKRHSIAYYWDTAWTPETFSVQAFAHFGTRGYSESKRVQASVPLSFDK